MSKLKLWKLYSPFQYKADNHRSQKCMIVANLKENSLHVLIDILQNDWLWVSALPNNLRLTVVGFQYYVGGRGRDPNYWQDIRLPFYKGRLKIQIS